MNCDSAAVSPISFYFFHFTKNITFFFSLRITKCHFHKYGPSGTIERHDAMCVLALNIINEKIYVFLWFWLIALAVLTSLYLLYVLSVIMVPSMRRVMVERNAKDDMKVGKREK